MRLRATLDVYVDMHDGTSEEDAMSMVNDFIDEANTKYFKTETDVSLSEVIQHEVYDEDEI